MSYLLNKTDGTILTELIDGRIDTRSTNLTLVGRNYNGFGEAFNENFIRLLENFSNSSAPSNPLEGQTWWDKSDLRLKVYNGSEWKAAGGPFVQETRPDMVAGDLWIDNARKQLFAFDGQSLLLVGPNFTTEQGLSGFQVETILDSQARAKTLINLYSNAMLIAVISNEEFTPLDTNRIEELVSEDNPTGKIFKGFNVVDRKESDSETGAFRFIGVSESTDSLYSPETDEFRKANQFLPSDRAGSTTGTLEIKNTNGLRLANESGTIYNIQRIQNENFYIENQELDGDLSLRVKSLAKGSNTVDAVYIDAGAAKVGIFTEGSPQYTLDVGGDLRISGSLRVEGETLTVQSTTLQIQDKTIELAKSDEGAQGNDDNADGGGIELISSDDDKTILWFKATNSWTSNKSFNLSNPADSYRINNSIKLTQDKLENINSAPDLRTIGTSRNPNPADIGTGTGQGLEKLDVDFINLDTSTITENSVAGNGLTLVSVNGGMNITLEDDITLTNPVSIVGLATPISKIVADEDPDPQVLESDNSTAANKAYVDQENRLQPIVFSMDITGLGNSITEITNNLVYYLNQMYEATTAHNGKIAKIHTVSYTNVNAFDIESLKVPEFVNVVRFDNGNSVSVLQDIGFGDIPFPTPIRSLYTFKVVNGVWVRDGVQSY